MIGLEKSQLIVVNDAVHLYDALYAVTQDSQSLCEVGALYVHTRMRAPQANRILAGSLLRLTCTCIFLLSW